MDRDPIADRRPIAARRLRIVQTMTDGLVARGVSANAISVAGMVAALGAGVALGSVADASVAGASGAGQRWLWLAAAVLIPLRLLANMLDGMVAVGSGAASPLGEIFNEVPDRVSDTAVLAGLGWAAGSPVLGLAAGLAALATAYIRSIGKGLGHPSDYCGPGAKQQRMAIVVAASLWCAVAPRAWAAPVPLWAVWLVLVLASITVVRRLWRLFIMLGR